MAVNCSNVRFAFPAASRIPVMPPANIAPEELMVLNDVTVFSTSTFAICTPNLARAVPVSAKNVIAVPSPATNPPTTGFASAIAPPNAVVARPAAPAPAPIISITPVIMSAPAVAADIPVCNCVTNLAEVDTVVLAMVSESLVKFSLNAMPLAWNAASLRTDARVERSVSSVTTSIAADNSLVASHRSCWVFLPSLIPLVRDDISV